MLPDLSVNEKPRRGWLPSEEMRVQMMKKSMTVRQVEIRLRGWGRSNTWDGQDSGKMEARSTAIPLNRLRNLEAERFWG